MKNKFIPNIPKSIIDHYKDIVEWYYTKEIFINEYVHLTPSDFIWILSVSFYTKKSFNKLLNEFKEIEPSFKLTYQTIKKFIENDLLSYSVPLYIYFNKLYKGNQQWEDTFDNFIYNNIALDQLDYTYVFRDLFLKVAKDYPNEFNHYYYEFINAKSSIENNKDIINFKSIDRGHMYATCCVYLTYCGDIEEWCRVNKLTGILNKDILIKWGRQTLKPIKEFLNGEIYKTTVNYTLFKKQTELHIKNK